MTKFIPKLQDDEDLRTLLQTYLTLDDFPANETSSSGDSVMFCILCVILCTTRFVRRRHKVKREKSSAKRLAKALHLLLARRQVMLHVFVYPPSLSLSSTWIQQVHPSSAHRDPGTLFNPFIHTSLYYYYIIIILLSFIKSYYYYSRLFNFGLF